MIDRFTLVREYRLRDLIERLDQALLALELYDIDENETATIKQRDLCRAENAIEAAATYLHELRLRGTAT